MILVLPDAFTVYSGSMFSNSPTTGDWEAFVADDLVAYIDGHYRTIADRSARGLAGHSMGGYGTVRIGMKHPEAFCALCDEFLLSAESSSTAASGGCANQAASERRSGESTFRTGGRLGAGPDEPAAILRSSD